MMRHIMNLHLDFLLNGTFFTLGNYHMMKWIILLNYIVSYLEIPY